MINEFLGNSGVQRNKVYDPVANPFPVPNAQLGEYLVYLESGWQGTQFLRYNIGGGNIQANIPLLTGNLYVGTQLQIDIASKGAGKVFTSDANGIGTWQTPVTGGSWGAITGTLSNQTDLLQYLGGKQNLHGFENRTSSSISFVDGTRTFTITGTNFKLWNQGTEVLKNTESIVIPNLNGIHFIYYNSSNVLTTSQTAWTIGTDLPIAIIFWNGTNGLIGEERHRSSETHLYLHSTFRTAYASGLSATYGNTTFQVDSGILFDEDIQLNIPTTTQARIFYRSGANFTFTAKQTNPFLVSGTHQYDNAGTLSPVTANNYYAIWVYGTDFVSDGIIHILGQRQDVNLTNARNNNLPGNLNLTGLAIPEMKLLYRIIVRNDANPYIETLDYRTSSIVGANVLVTDHQTLTNRSAADVHPITSITGFPDQTGNSGKYLTTDGTNLSFGTVATLPLGTYGQIARMNAGGTAYQLANNIYFKNRTIDSGSDSLIIGSTHDPNGDLYMLHITQTHSTSGGCIYLIPTNTTSATLRINDDNNYINTGAAVYAYTKVGFIAQPRGNTANGNGTVSNTLGFGSVVNGDANATHFKAIYNSADVFRVNSDGSIFTKTGVMPVNYPVTIANCENTITETTIASFVIPANTMLDGDIILFELVYDIFQNYGTVNLDHKFFANTGILFERLSLSTSQVPTSNKNRYLQFLYRSGSYLISDYKIGINNLIQNTNNLTPNGALTQLQNIRNDVAFNSDITFTLKTKWSVASPLVYIRPQTALIRKI